MPRIEGTDRWRLRGRPVGWLALLLALALAGCATGDDAQLDLLPEPAAADAASVRLSDGAAGFGLQAEAFLQRLQRRLDQAFAQREPLFERQKQLGEELAARILKEARLSRDAAMRRRLQKIVARLKRAADTVHPVRWRLHLIDSDQADAFTTGGGHLFITTGMVRLLQRDERIATVLAHEMAHDLMGHVLLARDKKEMARRAQAFSRKVLAGDLKMDWLSRSMNFIVLASLNTYSRQQEHDADAEGLDIMVRAGFAPQAALETFDFLSRHFRDQPALQNFFYGIHPNYSSRRWHLANVIRAHYRRQAGLPEVPRANWRRGPRTQEGQ